MRRTLVVLVAALAIVATTSSAEAATARTCPDATIGGKRWVVQSVHGLSCSAATSIVRTAAKKVVPKSRKLGTISGLTCISYAPVGKPATAVQCWTDNLSKQVNGALSSLAHPGTHPVTTTPGDAPTTPAQAGGAAVTTIKTPITPG